MGFAIIFFILSIYCVFIFTHLGPVVDAAYLLNIMHILGFGILDIFLRAALMSL
jgi:uncharacterized membrane protein required for colicin V production